MYVEDLQPQHLLTDSVHTDSTGLWLALDGGLTSMHFLLSTSGLPGWLTRTNFQCMGIFAMWRWLCRWL